MNRRFWIVAGLAAGALLAGCAAEPQTATVGGKAPDFSLNDTSGSVVSLSDYQDVQPVLLYFHMAVG
jgi:uncharacterized lipoprotein YajG